MPHSQSASSGSQTALRGLNTASLTAALTATGPQTQAELARATGLSRATVSNIVNLEVAAGRYRTERVLHHGRWAQLVSLVPEDWVVVGVDIGRSHLRVAGWDTSRRVFGERLVALERGHAPAETFALASEVIDELVAEAGLSRSQVRRAGIAVPASISPDGHVVAQAVLRPWSGMNLAEVAAEVLRLDVVVDNDANLGAYAHAGEQDGNLLYLKQASGIGAGFLVRDRLYHSTSGLVGEIGHVAVVEGGQMCYCGARGCLETLASTRSVVEAFSHVQGYRATIDDVVAGIADGNVAALRIVSEAGDAIGRVLSMVCNLLSPDLVVIGGPLAGPGSPMLDAVVAAVRYRVQPAVLEATRFAASSLESRAEVLGACLAALNPPAGSAQGEHRS